ncbi:transferrin receptor protein 1 isoform X2 [Ranitomeya variabilis]
MKMDRARTTITNIFGRVPLTYTRFSLTPQTDGDSSQVEMKLADEEECGDQPMGDHLVSHQSGKNGCKSLCFKILVVVLLFLIGFLIGYLTYRGRACPRQSSNGDSEACLMANGVTEDEEPEPAMPTIMYWSSVRAMFVKKLDATSFVTQISRMASDARDAGGDNEDNLAKMVHDNFNSAGLDKVWDDEHYVTLQDFTRNNNVTLLNGDSAEWMRTPTSYVAYSYAASVTGNLVYGNQGTEKDLKDLSGKIDLKGKVILMRSALIPFSEKVRNAERVGAAGVLIYPEPMDMRFPDGKYSDDIEAPFGHAHFGTGDPFTPGFPSFNHTQFPPSISSGLPQIPVQTLSSNDGRVLYDKLQSAGCVGSGLSGCTLKVLLQVNNTMADKKIYNVFGVIKGLEPDRYVVVGAQRDAVGMGTCKAAVGTSLLMELARMLSEMVKEGYKPRRSIVFASWSAGDYGAVGATEWLEGYLTTLHLKAISYISLDAIIQGSESLQVSTSPLLYNMIVKILKEIPDPVSNGQMSPKFSYGFPMDDSAYPFLTYSGIPSASFRFQKEDRRYAYLGTDDDTFEHFDKLVNINSMCRTAANITGQIILRLTHDHKLPLDFTKYTEELLRRTMDLNKQKGALINMNLDVKWMNSALGDFNRAVATLKKDFLDSDLENNPFLRSLNDRIMKVEHSMLFPYVSPKESPFRHILYGYGNHTFDAMKKHLDLLKEDKSKFNEDVFKNQLALLTWTVQSAANALEGEIWEIDNEF